MHQRLTMVGVVADASTHMRRPVRRHSYQMLFIFRITIHHHAIEWKSFECDPFNSTSSSANPEQQSHFGQSGQGTSHSALTANSLNFEAFDGRQCDESNLRILELHRPVSRQSPFIFECGTAANRLFISALKSVPGPKMAATLTKRIAPTQFVCAII